MGPPLPRKARLAVSMETTSSCQHQSFQKGGGASFRQEEVGGERVGTGSLGVWCGKARPRALAQRAGLARSSTACVDPQVYPFSILPMTFHPHLLPLETDLLKAVT